LLPLIGFSANPWHHHRHALPIVLVHIAKRGDEVVLLELQGYQNVGRGCDSKHEMPDGHRRREPEGDDKAEHPALVFRWLNDTMNYVFRINGYGLDGASWIQLMCNMDNRNQNVEYIATVPWGGMSKGVWYTMKVLTEGSRIQCKVWKKSDPEPSSWNLDVQDTRYTHGLIGLEYFWGTHQFDNVFVQGQGFPYVSLPVWSRWGIGLFLALLAGTAVVLLRRRSRPTA